jgi:hypothetical protein
MVTLETRLLGRDTTSQTASRIQALAMPERVSLASCVDLDLGSTRMASGH